MGNLVKHEIKLMKIATATFVHDKKYKGFTKFIKENIAECFITLFSEVQTLL
jgi:hypothetical protein